MDTRAAQTARRPLFGAISDLDLGVDLSACLQRRAGDEEAVLGREEPDDLGEHRLLVLDAVRLIPKGRTRLRGAYK